VIVILLYFRTLILLLILLLLLLVVVVLLILLYYYIAVCYHVMVNKDYHCLASIRHEKWYTAFYDLELCLLEKCFVRVTRIGLGTALQQIQTFKQH